MGRAILGALEYAKTQGYLQDVQGWIRGLPTETKLAFEQRIRASAWYPYSAYVALLDTLDPELDPSDPAAAYPGAVDFGLHALGRDATGVLRILSVFSSVEGLVHRGFGSWGNFLWNRHCDTGTVFLAETGDKMATMGLRAFPDISPAHCHLTIGYLQAMGQAVGAADIRMTKIRCVHRGDDSCQYRGEWS